MDHPATGTRRQLQGNAGMNEQSVQALRMRARATLMLGAESGRLQDLLYNRPGQRNAPYHPVIVARVLPPSRTSSEDFEDFCTDCI